MRRGAGIGAIKKQNLAQAKFKDKGTELSTDQLNQMSKQLDSFKSKLEEFAAKHSDKIRKNPTFRAKFQQMCATVGVDPLASSKGFWSEMLGVGDFYYQLGVKIVELCMALSHRTGGLMDIEDLCSRLNKARSVHESEISVDDCQRAVKKLRSLGNGFTIVTLGSHQLVQSVPGELSMDHASVLGLAEDNGHVNLEFCMTSLNWTAERARKTLNSLVQEGMCWVDDQSPDSKRTYWFPSLFTVSS